MKRILIIIAFALNMFSMVTDSNWGTATAQTLDNEYGYECEEPDGFRYISPIPCDAVEICREQCPLCGDFADCDVMWMHTCYTPDSELGEEKKQNDNTSEFNNGGGDSGASSLGTSSGNKNNRPNTTEKTPKEKALDLINYYRWHTSSSRFFNSDIYISNYLSELENVINNPESINQGNNGTCGAAALMKLLAEIAPSDLVNVAMELFTNGKYKAWDWSIPEDMRNCTNEHLNEINQNGANAIIQTAIINGNNKVLEYNGNTDGQNNENGAEWAWDGFKSFMWPGYIPDFMNKFYPGRLTKQLVNPEYDAIKDIDYSKEFVIAAVDYKNGGFAYDHSHPTHYVQIISVSDRNYFRGDYEIQYWNYGKTEASYNNQFTGIYYLYRIRR